MRILLSLIACALLTTQPHAHAQGLFEAGAATSTAGSTGRSSLGAALSRSAVSKKTDAKPVKRMRLTAEAAAAYANASNKAFADGKQREAEGKFTEADTLYAQAFELRYHVWGNSDPAIIKILEMRGKVCQKDERYSASEDCFRRVLSILSRKVGPGSATLCPTISSLGDVCMSQGRYSDAASYYKQLLALMERHPSDGDMGAIKCRLKLANALTAAWQIDEADEVYQHAVLAAEEHHPSALRSTLESYRSFLTKAGREQDAMHIAEKIGVAAKSD